MANRGKLDETERYGGVGAIEGSPTRCGKMAAMAVQPQPVNGELEALAATCGWKLLNSS